MNTIQTNANRFLNSCSWDISLSEELQNGRASGENYHRHIVKLLVTNWSLHIARYLRTMKVPRPVYLSPTAMNSEQLHLLGFCM